MRTYRGKTRLFLPAAALLYASAGWANPSLNPIFPNFSLVPLGSISGIPPGYQYGGLGFNGSNLLLSGGDPTVPGFQAIYTVPVDRTNGEITGFGTASLYATVKAATSPSIYGDSLAGGLTFAPNGTLLYTTNSQNNIGQYSPSATTSSVTSVGGIPLGSIGYLPNGQLVLTALQTPVGHWYPVTLSNPDGNGIYQVNVGAAFSGVDAPADSFAVFAAGLTPSVTATSVLVGDSAVGALKIYGLDGNGHPTGTGTVFVSDPQYPIGSGLMADPGHSGNYLFTRLNPDTNVNEIWSIEVDTPEASTVWMATGAIVLFWLIRQRRDA